MSAATAWPGGAAPELADLAVGSPPRLRGRLALALVSAGLYGLAMPPWSVPGLAAVMLLPLFVALRDLSPGAGAIVGLVWGSAAIWAVGWWVPGALSFYYQQPLWFGVLFALVASVVFAGSYGLGFGACAAWIGRRTDGVRRALAFAALWVAWELARARFLSGDPWLLCGYALVPYRTLRQAADFGGVYVLSFAVALVSASLAEAFAAGGRLASGARRPLAAALAAIAALLAYGSARLAAPLAPGRELSVALVQGNLALGTQWRSEFYGLGLDRYVELSRAALVTEPASLLVWPESAVTFFLVEEPVFRAQIAAALRDAGAELILGGPHREHDEGGYVYYNSAYLLRPSGEVADRYDKEHLLPFAEYFPMRTIEFLRRRFERVRYFTAGDDPTPLEGRFGRAAVAICFEAIFPEIIRDRVRAGAEVIVNLSNDAWLGFGAGPEQHLAMASLRTVENRVWLLRATTTGVSAVVDPYGDVRARTGSGAEGTLTARIRLGAVATPYQLIGDAFAYGCVLSALAAMIAVRPRRRGARSADTAEERAA